MPGNRTKIIQCRLIISGYITTICTCNTTYIVLTNNISRFSVNKVFQFRTSIIAANQTANIVVTGNSAVVTSIGYTAGISTNQTANVIAATSYTGCVNNIFHCTFVPNNCTVSIYGIIFATIILADNTANVIFTADDTFVIAAVHIAVVNANDTANFITISATIGYTKAVNKLYITCINTYNAAKSLRSAIS